MLLYFRKKTITQIIETLFGEFDKHFDNVSLLISGDTNFSDYSLRNLSVTNFNSCTINTTTKKFGNGSISFTGSSSLPVQNGSHFAFGQGDFTIEFWMNAGSGQNDKLLFDFRAAGSNNHMHITTGGYGGSTPGGIRYVSNSGSPAAGLYTTTNLLDNTWHHIAVVRYNGVASIFVDGVKSAFTSDTFNFTGVTGQMFIGTNSYFGGPYYTGLLDDIRITKGLARYTSNFVVSTIAHPTKGYEIDYDQYWDQTVLSIHGNLTDATGKNTITPGSVTTSTSVVKNGTNSMYFGGTSWLHIPASSNFEFGTEDFTIETWWYPTTVGTRQWLFHSQTDYWLGLDYQPSTGLGMWMSSNGTSWNIIHSDSGGGGISNRHLVANAWNHVAMTRSGTTFSLFLNGELIKTVTGVTAGIVNRASELKVIGSWAAVTGNPAYNHQLPISGYLDDFRVTRGVARYVTNFIPKISTANSDVGSTFDPYWDNVSVLLDSATPLSDASSYNRSLTLLGNTQSSSTTPYASGNSISFNGTTDYLTIPAAANISIENEWTIEGMVKFGSGNSGQQIWSGYSTSQFNWALYTNAANTLSLYLSSNGTTWNIASGSVIINNFLTSRWYHIAIVKTATNYMVFVDGINVTSITNATNVYNNSNVISIGGMQGGYLTNCLITDFRVTKGIARYTANFATPTNALKTQGYTYVSGENFDQHWNNVILMNSGNTIPTDQKGNSFTNTNVTIETAVTKFGGTSLYFNPSSVSYMISDTSKSLSYLTNNFTIEGWYYSTSYTAGHDASFMASNWAGGWNTSSWWVGKHQGVGGKVIGSFYGASALLQEPDVPALNTWNHYAFVRSGNTLSMFRNGVMVSSATLSNAIGSSGLGIIIGANPDNKTITGSFKGYMQDIRITRGKARYLANFTPNTTALPVFGASY